MEIIIAELKHLENVYELICELEDERMDMDNFSQMYRDNLNNSNVHYYLALNEGDIIGFASLHIQKLLHHCAKIGELQEIIVSKKWQGNSIGSNLFNHILKVAKSNQCQQLEVCCNMVRENSHRFYLKQGMKRSHFKFIYLLN